MRPVGIHAPRPMVRGVETKGGVDKSAQGGRAISPEDRSEFSDRVDSSMSAEGFESLVRNLRELKHCHKGVT